MTQVVVVEGKSELDSYLEELRDKSISFNILDWWKVNSAKYPVISRMACDILAILVSTAASESAFSTRGRVLDQYRSCLKSDTVEVLICAQDWIRSQQHNDDTASDEFLDILKVD
eukprot:TRINITY_DN1817_c0_g1_i5.p3 TRINITY_DN1817_c0_g1~~TRINITY_DN1817_c0_g1_i5.p3  ORF type:complete len:115 (+),score=11.60 TRINITY_DN1817_c0_g1_i5:1383-1727(+)